MLVSFLCLLSLISILLCSTDRISMSGLKSEKLVMIHRFLQHLENWLQTRPKTGVDKLKKMLRKKMGSKF